jgi:hypothetical protein
MKTTIAILTLILIANTVNSQISEGTATFNKIERTAVVGNFNYAPEVVKAVILEDMKYNGFIKSSETKGYKLFPGILFTQISQEKIDFYLKVDDVKNEKDQSIVYILISKGGENFINNSTDPDAIRNCIAYLQGLIPKFEANQLEIDITKQEAVIKKAEKTFNSLVGTGESLKSKKQDIEENIAKNLKEQENQKLTLEKERQLLETLKSKRK